MVDADSVRQPCVLFMNINGNGTGHLSTCLAYANRIRDRARPVFFSLASAIEAINGMGFEAEYFVSRFWSRASSIAWDRQLALRLGLVLEHIRPSAIVFDGNWPYRGLFAAARAYGSAHLVWSNLVLFKQSVRPVPVPEGLFDLVIRLGELGSEYCLEPGDGSVRRIRIPPATILRHDELLDREAARARLGLEHDRKYVLFSLGPGNLKDVGEIGRGLADHMTSRGYSIVWARAPISAKDEVLPPGVQCISEYPLARYLRAFDAVVGAAGYNSCSELVQARLPALLVPNLQVADDQARRADLLAQASFAVVSPCETDDQRRRAVARLLTLVDAGVPAGKAFDLSGAEIAAEEIMRLAR